MNATPKAPAFPDTRAVAAALELPLSRLTYLAYALPQDERYRAFLIRCRSNRLRLIHAPIRPLKELQQRLMKLLQPAYVPRAQVHGYIADRSPISNAEVHKYRNWILHIDIEDFFPSITKRRIRGLFRAFPFYYDEAVAELLAQICTAFGRLPQGAPTSPLISNLICRGLDARLSKLASESRCSYSRYCDDISFSTSQRNFPSSIAIVDRIGEKPTLGDALNQLVITEGFKLRSEKTTIRHRTERQLVTGLTVNQFVNVPRSYVRSLRNLLYIWSKYGKEVAEESFEKQWQPNRPNGKTRPSLEQIVRGRVQYVGSIKGWYDPVYRKLARSLAQVDQSYTPTAKHSERPKTVIVVHCEGKSDTKQLIAAWRRYRHEYPQLDPRFVDGGGDSELLGRMRSLASIHQSVASVGLFDRDNPKVIKQVIDSSDAIKRWARGVYSMVLPYPDHRAEGEPLCIEMVHRDETLMRKDRAERRVFKRSEFKENGFHEDGNAVMMKAGSSALIATEVRDVRTQLNIALSKDDFAELVARGEPPFDNVDFSGFRPIFDRLCDVRQRWLLDRLEPF